MVSGTTIGVRNNHWCQEQLWCPEQILVSGTAIGVRNSYGVRNNYWCLEQVLVLGTGVRYSYGVRNNYWCQEQLWCQEQVLVSGTPKSSVTLVIHSGSVPKQSVSVLKTRNIPLLCLSSGTVRLFSPVRTML